MSDRKAELFWRKVNRDGPVPAHRPQLGPCWLWTGGGLAKGYGGLRGYRQRTTYAHRFSWTLHNGEPGTGMQVLHRCDNRRCVRPDHLFLGTNDDNVADMVAKGRQAAGDTHMARTRPETLARGERHGHAKLTEEQVRLIRSTYAAGSTQKQLCATFRISQGVVSAIINRKLWKTIA